MIPKKKRRGNTSPGRTHGGKAMAEAKRALDREALPQDWTWYQQMWSRIIFFLFWPFQWLNVTYGPIASNAFGFLVIFLAMFAPGLFEDKADRELKLKERVVIAKNTRVRVRAAQSVEAYQNAVHQITDEDLAYPLKNLRKMLRLPPADPASYSQVRYPLSGLFPAHIRSSLSNSLPSLCLSCRHQAVKDVKKEVRRHCRCVAPFPLRRWRAFGSLFPPRRQVIRVNGEIIQPGPRSLDRAIQAIKRSLVTMLNVREADASQMTSTVPLHPLTPQHPSGTVLPWCLLHPSVANPSPTASLPLRRS